MNNILRGLYAGFIAILVLALLYFVDYGPGNNFYKVSAWFAIGNKDTGRLYGFLLLVGLGLLFGLIFGAIQRGRAITFSRAIVSGLLVGLVWWVVFAFIVALTIGHMPLAQFTLGTVLFSLGTLLVYGFLLGTVYFQSTIRENSQRAQ